MITSIPLIKLRNAEFYQFCSDITSTLFSYNPTALGIIKPYNVFSQSIQNIDALFKLNRTSVHTEELIALDERRDKAIIGILLYVESMTYHFDINISKQATMVLNQINTYGTGIARQNYQTETATLSNIIRDWDTKPEYTNAIGLLNLMLWKNELAETNTLFNAKYLERAKDDSENVSTETMKEKRAETTAAWQKLKSTIESIYTIREMEGAGFETYDAVIKNINVIIEKYNTLLASRK